MPANTLSTYGPMATCRIACHAMRLAIPRLSDIFRSALSAGAPDDAEAMERTRTHVRAAAAAPVLATLVPGAHAASIVGGWYAYAAASDPDRLPYDLSFWRVGASVVGTAMATWLAFRPPCHRGSARRRSCRLAPT